MIRALAVGLLALTLPNMAWAAEARLWIVPPAPAWDLSNCPQHATRAVLEQSAEARLLGSDASVRWDGGRFSLRGEAGNEENVQHLSDRCFALMVDGRVVVAGATLLPYSARLLRFPVLQVLTRRQGEALEFELTPAFPATKSTITSQAWHDALSGLR